MLQAAAGADALFGRFVLDPAQSSGSERCAVIALEDLGNGKFRMSATAADEKGARSLDGVFAFDGQDHPAGSGISAAFTRIDDFRYAVVFKGEIQATAMRTLSADGATLTEIADGLDGDDAFHAERVYTRGEAVCGSNP